MTTMSRLAAGVNELLEDMLLSVCNNLQCMKAKRIIKMEYSKRDPLGKMWCTEILFLILVQLEQVKQLMTLLLKSPFFSCLMIHQSSF